MLEEKNCICYLGLILQAALKSTLELDEVTYDSSASCFLSL